MCTNIRAGAVILVVVGLLVVGQTGLVFAQTPTPAISVETTTSQTYVPMLLSLLRSLQSALALREEQVLQPGAPLLADYLVASSSELTTRTVFYTKTYRCVLERDISSSTLAMLPTITNLSFQDVYMSLFFSDEYLTKQVSNEVYVQQLYKCILGRTPDPTGAAKWVTALVNNKNSRELTLEKFITSTEFTQTVVPKLAVQLSVATSTVSASNTTLFGRVDFVATLYQCVLKRRPDGTGLMAWLKLPNATTFERIFTNMLTSTEYQNISSGHDFMVDAYTCIMDEPLADDARIPLNDFVKVGGTHAGLVNQIVASEAFVQGRGLRLSRQTGFSLALSYPNMKTAWPAWKDLLLPFTAGIRSRDRYAGTPESCNNVSVYAGTPLLRDFLVSRQLQNECDPGRWKLVGVQPTWSDTLVEFTKISDVFNPTASGTAIGDGTVIFSAYDPTAMDYDGKTWIAFECFSPSIGVGACMGPLTANRTLDTKQTFVMVNANEAYKNDTHAHSASVPKLLSFKGKQYLYWTDVRRRLKTGIPWNIDYSDTGTYLNTKGIGIAYDAQAKRFYPIDAAGQFIKGRFTPNDSRAVVVADIDTSNLRSNRVADVATVVTDGTYLYAVLAQGGGDCLAPTSLAEGCYRNTVSRTTSPLTYNTFRSNLISEEYMPKVYQAYPRFAYRYDTNSTWMIGGQFVNPLALPDQPVGKWAFPWPDNIAKPE